MIRQNSRYGEMVGARAAQAAVRCMCQSLESRLLMAAVNWDGGPTGNGTDFLTPANWVGDVLPAAIDTAVIGATGTSPTITISGTPAVQTITSSRNLQLNGGTISGGTLAFSGGASMLASTLGGTLSNVAITGDVLLNANGVGVILAGTTSFTAARLSAGNLNLAMAPGYTLNSTVVAEGAAGGARNIGLAFGGVGTVTFGPSAVVRLAAGVGGPLNINNSSVSTLINNGLISSEATGAVGQQILIQNSTLTNNGTMQTLTGGTLTVNPTNWTNAGTVTGTSGIFNLGGTFNATGGIGTFTTSALTVVNVFGTINNTGNTINLNGTTGSLTIAGGTINNGSIVATGGTNVVATTSGGTLSSVAITGDVLLSNSGVGVILAGNTTFTTARLSAGNVNLAMVPGYTLNSTVVAEGAAGGARRMELAFGGAGTVTFGPAAVVRLAAGVGGPLNINNSSVSTLVNNGLITSEATGAVGQQILIQNSALTNNGTMQTLTSGALAVQPTNWTNPGTITTTSGSTLSLGGNWSNAGSITATNATTNLGGSFTTAGIGTFTRSGGTVNLAGTLNNTAATLTLNSGSWNIAGGTINNGSVVATGGSSLLATTTGGTLSSVAITGDVLLSNSGVGVILAGNTTFTTARLSAGNVNLAMAPGYTLNSTVIADGAAGGARNFGLAFGGVGTVTFGPSAVVRLAAGVGGPLNINNSSVSTLVNNGLITSEATGAVGQQILIQKSALTNNGTMQTLTGGTLTVNPTNWTNPGTVTGSTGTFNLGGTLNATGGIGTFTTSALTAVNITGTINNAGNTINLNSVTGSWSVSGGTINDGSLIETGGAKLVVTTSSGRLSNLAITGDLLLNATNVGLILAGNTSFTAARLSANNVNLAMAPGYALNSPVIVEGAAGGTRRMELGFGGAGTVTFSPSATVRLAAGSGGGLLIQNSSAATLVNNGLITAEATGQQILIQPTAVTNNGTMRASNGSAFNVNSNFSPNSGQLQADGLGSVLTIQAGTYSINQPATTTNNGMVYFRGTSTKAANFNASGRFVLDYTGAANTPFAQIKADVISGYTGGAWNGPGINSSAAAVTPRTAVGYGEASSVLSAAGGVFAGVNVDGTAVLVRYTLAGDTNLNGTVDIGDFAKLAAKFNQSGEWTDGDTNYDGQVEIGDFSLLASNFNNTMPVALPKAQPFEVATAQVTRRPAFGSVRIGGATSNPAPNSAQAIASVLFA